MLRITRDHKWEEFKNVFGGILACNDRKEAMRILNGIRAGFQRSTYVSPQKKSRINAIEDLIKFYK